MEDPDRQARISATGLVDGGDSLDRDTDTEDHRVVLADQEMTDYIVKGDLQQGS